MSTAPRYHIKNAVTLLALAIVLAGPLAADARLFPKQIVPQECTLGAIRSTPGGCTVCHIGVMTMNLTTTLMYAIAIPAAGLLAAIGGITLLVSGGSETLHKQGVQTLTYAVSGILIVFLAWIAVDTIMKTLTLGKDQFVGALGQPWYQLPVNQCGIK